MDAGGTGVGVDAGGMGVGVDAGGTGVGVDAGGMGVPAPHPPTDAITNVTAIADANHFWQFNLSSSWGGYDQNRVQ